MLSALLVAVGISAVAADFSPAGVQAILNAHNQVRSSLAQGRYVARGVPQPPAANMLKMKWDAGLAAQAQAYANSCPTGHSPTQGIGENLFWHIGPDAGDVNQWGSVAVKAWEDEFQQFGLPAIKFDSNLFSLGVGHATQVAWAKSGSVGCGVAVCPYPGLQKIAVCCQYRPTGNYLGLSIYKQGPACSQCPSGSSCEPASGLCA